MTDKKATEGVEGKKLICWPSPGCIHNCGLTATVKDGKLICLKGNKDSVTTNRGCANRMPHFPKWLYSPEQLLHPLKRKGERGKTGGNRYHGIRPWMR